MKKILIFLGAFFCYFNSWSQNITNLMATKVAEKHMAIRGKMNINIIQTEALINEGDTCLYKIIFENGEWYLISTDKRVTPIVAYGDDCTIFVDLPDAFLFLLSSYENQISDIKNGRNEMPQTAFNNLWDNLLDTTRAIPTEYHPTDILLDKTNRGKIMWGQYGNNDNTCTPSYNDACEYDDDCDCSHKPVGCGAVAMGMIMWYWQWPRTSSEIHCRWNLIPPELHWNTPAEEVNELTRFLRDCGEMVDMTYWCRGAWCLMDDINSALHDLGYEHSVLHKKDDWGSSAWNKLIISEIENNRPVIYYGQPGINFTEGHYFVVDGYDWAEKFHINFGHKGNGGWFYLDNIVEDNTNYSSNQYAIVGISPTYKDTNIMQLPYSTIPNHQWRTEYAFNSMSIPSSGSNLVAQDGSEVFLEAGQEIVLAPGFEACAGSSLEARINPILQSQMEISISELPQYVIWGGGGYTIDVSNADSWEFIIKSLYGEPVFYNAGTVENEPTTVNLWNGTGLYEFYYIGNIRFKNSFGRELYTGDFVFGQITRSGEMQQNDSCFDSEEQFYMNKPSIASTNNINIYPNPSKDIFMVEKLDGAICSLEVFSTIGTLLFSDDSIDEKVYVLNLSEINPGIYYLVINGNQTKKIIKQ